MLYLHKQSESVIDVIEYFYGIYDYDVWYFIRTREFSKYDAKQICLHD